MIKNRTLVIKLIITNDPTNPGTASPRTNPKIMLSTLKPKTYYTSIIHVNFTAFPVILIKVF